MREEQVEPTIGRETEPIDAPNPVICRSPAKVAQVRVPGVQLQALSEQVAIAHFFHGEPRCIKDAAHQIGHLTHEAAVIPARAIPLQETELGVVKPPALAVAKDLTRLVDGPAARRQQPLHGKLRGRLEIERQPSGSARAVPPGAQAVQGWVAGRSAGGDGCLDLQYSPVGEKATDGLKHASPGD